MLEVCLDKKFKLDNNLRVFTFDFLGELTILKPDCIYKQNFEYIPMCQSPKVTNP